MIEFSDQTGAALLAVLRDLRTYAFTGDPKRDWLEARQRLANCGVGVWREVADYAEQLVSFQRGQHIASGLTKIWQERGHYATARDALNAAIAQEQLLSGTDDLRGIHVMTLHKAKGKEFDAVVIFDDSNSCPLNYCRENAPYPRSRRLLRVGITRARYHTLMLTDMYNPSPLLQGFHL